MEKEKLETLLIDYIDNRLNSVDRHKVEQELVTNTEAYKLYEELKEVMNLMDRSARLEPSAKLRSEFDQLLKEEMASDNKGKTILFQPAFYRAAAAVALLVIGGSIGYYINQQNTERLARVEKVLEENRKQNEAIRQMMAMLSNNESASQRIQGVNVAYTVDHADAEIVGALVNAMNEDPNSNVRLAALEALSKFSSEPQVRKELIKALPKQKDPVVQIALIQLLVKMKEKGVVNDLQHIVDDAKTMKAVKDEAYSGILRLS